MGVYRKAFETEDDYEAWARRYGDQVTVLAVNSVEAPPTRSGMTGRRSVMVTYQASDRMLAGPSRQASMPALAAAAVGIIALLVLLYGVI
jgi:hypothetical protein